MSTRLLSNHLNATDSVRPEALRRFGRSNSSTEMTRQLAGNIRGPLTRVSTLVESLIRNNKVASNGLEDAHTIREQLAQIHRILDSFARSERGHVRPPNLKLVDLSAIANECLLILATNSPEGTRFDLNQGDGLLPVFADPVQISNIICTLARHALQAEGSSGHVVIETGRKSDGNTARVFLRVSNDGIALDENARASLFDTFGPVSNDDASPSLFIVKRIIDMHSGEITVESPRQDVGRGTRITVWLPELYEFQI